MKADEVEPTTRGYQQETERGQSHNQTYSQQRD